MARALKLVPALNLVPASKLVPHLKWAHTQRLVPALRLIIRFQVSKQCGAGSKFEVDADFEDSIFRSIPALLTLQFLRNFKLVVAKGLHQP